MGSLAVKTWRNYMNLALLVGLIGCGSDKENPTADDRHYFPLQKGFYQIYSVEETMYNGNVPNLRTYELKIEVIDSLASGNNEYTYTIHRSSREDESSPWEYMDTWSARVTPREAVINEGNISYLKLSFPLGLNAQWNGNAYNNSKEDEYKIVKLNDPFTANGVEYKNCVVVEQENNEDRIVFYDQRSEVYSRDIGLIYKELKQYYYCTSNDCLGQEEIQSGIEYRQSILSYGK